MKNKGMSSSNRKFFEDYSSNVEHHHHHHHCSKGILVFKGTNLSVFYVGSLLNVQSKVETLEEYPYLTIDDLLYAKLYYNQEVNRPLVENTEDKVQGAIEKFRKIAEQGAQK